jgi:transcriptional regulator with XRE-family HTH domain
MREEAKRIRTRAKVTQVKMSALMGMKGRSSYADLESGYASWHPRHTLLLDRVSLLLAARFKDPELLTPDMRRDVEAIR